MVSFFKKKIRARAPFLRMSDRHFLEIVYREILGREIDRDGLESYTRLLNEGRTRWEVVLSLIRSEEFIHKSVREHVELTSDRTFLEKVYPIFYHREIDEDGQQVCSQLLKQGHNRIDILSVLANSGEFINRVLRDNLPLADIRSRKPECYHPAEDFLRKEQALVFTAEKPEDFDWLEQTIQETGYYERPGIWSFDLDLDKQVMAEILAFFNPRKVLELGCSNGAVLKCLYQRGIAGEGVEISAMAKTRAFPEIKNRIHLGDLLGLDLPSGYELIFGLDIFEHFNPNKIGAYAERIGELMKEGGYFYCAIPAFGDDPVFGTVFPLYFREWEEERSGLLPFRTLHVDGLGYPIHGHLIWADTSWWVRQFEQAGLVRESSLEKAIHEKYDAYWEVRAKARQSFYVFSKKGEAEINRRVIKAILSSSSTALAGFPGSSRDAR